MCWDSDYIVWFNKTLGWSNEYTLLRYDAVPWILRFFLNLIFVLCAFFQENNSAGFFKKAIAGEEEGYVVVCRKVYKIGVTTIVLEFSPDFNLLFFEGVFFNRFQYLLFDTLYIKVLCPHFFSCIHAKGLTTLFCGVGVRRGRCSCRWLIFLLSCGLFPKPRLGRLAVRVGLVYS